MDEPLTPEQMFWLELLMTLRPGDPIGDMPRDVQDLLVLREFARMRFAAIEITFEGIRHLLSHRSS